MKTFGVALGFYFCWLIFGAIAGAVGAEDYDSMGPIERTIFAVFLLPWLLIAYLVGFAAWVAEKIYK